MGYRGRTSSRSNALPLVTNISDSFGQFGERFLIDTPEKKLLVAIVERAIKDIMLFRDPRSLSSPTWRNSPRRELTTEFQLTYFNSNSKSEWSLYWILEHIAADPEAELKKIRTLIGNILQFKELPKSYFYNACQIL